MSSPCQSCPPACFGARTDLRCHSLWRLARTGCPLVGPERKAVCVCQEAGGTEVCRGQESAGWERGESASRYCSSRQNRPYHCHHLSYCTGRNSDTGCKVTLYSSLWAPDPSPGTWYCCSTSISGGIGGDCMVGRGNRADFFSLKLVCVASLMLIMVTNICSLKLLHVSNPMMNCEEKKSLIFTKESLFPL